MLTPTPEPPKAGSTTTPPDETVAAAVNTTPLKNMFGIDAYEWNFFNSDPSTIDPQKMAAVQNFTAFRHYMDWNRIESTQGSYTFNPTHSGSWNYDAIYQTCKQDSILVLADLKNCPGWFLNANYPSDMRDDEDVPAPYGLNRSDPASYILQAKVAFQFAARYGANAGVDKSLVTVDASSRWTNDPANVVKIGLNTVKYIECDNERDKWWKGAKAQQTAQEYAANMSAFYDGNKGKMGKNVGVKSADPNMLVVMGGLASPDVQFVKDMIDWCKTNRGYRADGSVDLCFDVINYHFYTNSGNSIKTANKATGIAPELSTAGATADKFVMLAATLKNIPVWITESGFDINSASTQSAITIGDKSTLLTQADWIVRTSLMYARHKIDRLFFYQLYDDTPNGGGTYQTAGLINQDQTRRPAADYILQLKNLMGNYAYNSTVNSDPLVDKYVLGTKTMYALAIPDQTGRTAQYVLDLGTAKSANVYSLKAGANTMSKTTVNTTGGKLTVTVTETPVFIQAQ